MTVAAHAPDAHEQALSDAPTRPSRREPSSRTLAWVLSTYFAEGLPYMIVRILSAVYFTDVGAKERYIGYLNFLGIPWNLKFLWAPFVDALGTKRRWMIAVQLAITLATATLAATAAMTPTDGDPSAYLIATAVIFVVTAFLSATNDVVIDGYYLEGLPDRGDQAAYSGYRVMAYRIAMIFARSGLVAVAALAGRWLGRDSGPYLPWAYAFGAGAATMLVLTSAHAFLLPRVDAGPATAARLDPNAALATYGRAFSSYMRQEKVFLVLGFIVVYKLGDEILFSMVSPFLLRELAVTKDQFAWIAGVIGAAGSVLGAMAAGHVIRRIGLARAIWPLTLVMNVNILAYVWLAWVRPDAATSQGIAIIAAVHGYEQLAAGVGSGVLLVYILRTCSPDYRAAHYAIGSAIMSLGSTFVGGFGGRLVEAIGYLNLFWLAFAVSIPSMVLLFFVPLADEETAPSKAGASA